LRENSLDQIIAHELIGLECEVLESPNKSEIGLSGEIIDETMKTITIQTDSGMKMIQKKGRVFKIRYRRKLLRLSGDLIIARPEERIKKGLLIIKRSKGRKCAVCGAKRLKR
jgi:ribonuclease P protein subunit POP4